MNDREIMENFINFIRTAIAIAQLSDGNHFEVTFTGSNDKKQVIKVDVLSEDGTTEVEDKHHNESMQIALYSDELNEAREIIMDMSELINDVAYSEDPYPDSDTQEKISGVVARAKDFISKTENYPAINCDYYSPSDRKCTYGDGDDYCTEGPCEVWEQQREDRHD